MYMFHACMQLCWISFRSEVKKLITRLNEEKKVLKAEGLTVDGKHYKVEFKGCE